MTRSLASAVLDRLVIVVYGAGPPHGARIAQLLAPRRAPGREQTAHLVATEGGEPTVEQRRQLGALLAGRRVPVAVISDSARVRGSVTLLSWFHRQVKVFPRVQLADALAHLEIPTTRTDLVEDALRRLRTEVAGAGSR